MSAIRLRKITPTSPSSSQSQDADDKFSNSQTLTPNPKSSYEPEPDYTTAIPSSDLFRSLLLSNVGIGGDLTLALPPIDPSSKAPKQPLFFVDNSSFNRSKPSVTLSSLSKNGPVLGVVKINNWGPENIVGLGNPNPEFKLGPEFSSTDAEDDQSLSEVAPGMIWERLKKTSKWTHATYEFEYKGRRFTWRRLKQRVFGDQPDLELRENVESFGSLGDIEGESNSEVLAVYKGCQGLFTMARGTFWLRRGINIGASKDRKDVTLLGDDKLKNVDTEREEKDWNQWEIMVLLTALGIIEMARRMARARRSNGGGGGP